MSYKCCDCEHVFEAEEIASWEESRGVYWGTPCSENVSGCPHCHGDYEKAERCEICGECFFKDELFGGVCESCIDKHRKDFDICYKISLCEQKEIKINSLLANLICEADIEAILIKHIKEKTPNIDCSQFIDEDISWFGERLAEEVRKNENTKD